MDENILHKIIDESRILPNEFVLEIGAGIGTLTQVLGELAGHIVAVEVDKRFLPILKETTSGLRIKIVSLDALKLAQEDLEIQGKLPQKLISNLPYNIAASLLLKFLEEFPFLKDYVVMVQREVAQRILASPGNKAYGAFTLKLQYFASTKFLFPVSRYVFMPPPNVDSAVIYLRRLPEPPVEAPKEILFKLINAAFFQRRKRLVNALFDYPGLTIPKNKTKEALIKMGFSENIRGEALLLKDFSNLAVFLSSLDRN